MFILVYGKPNDKPSRIGFNTSHWQVATLVMLMVYGKPNDKPSTWPWDYHVETSCWTIPGWKLGARDQGRTWGWTTTIPVPLGRGCRGCSGETDAGFQQKCGKYGDGSKWSKAIVHPANHPSTLFAKSNVDSLIILIYSVNSINSIAFSGKYLDKNLTHLAGMPWMPWMWPCHMTLQELQQCPICLDTITDMVELSCQHRRLIPDHPYILMDD